MGSIPCSATRRQVLLIVADVQDAAVYFGVKRLHPAVQHLGKAGQLGDVFHRDAGVAQQLGGAAGGDQFHVHWTAGGKVHQPGLVGNA